jgi:hypothetical protein
VDPHFREWVRSLPAHDDARGDFIRNARDDREFPTLVRCLADFEDYLSDLNACDGAFRQAELLWEEYKKAAPHLLTSKCATCIPYVDCDFTLFDVEDADLEYVFPACIEPARLLALDVCDAASDLRRRQINLNDRAAVEAALAGSLYEGKPRGFIERAIRCAAEWER